MTTPMRICGVDEAGRGPLAGAVYAAAVVLDPARPIYGLADSKTLSEKRRVSLDIEIRETALAFCVAQASVAQHRDEGGDVGGVVVDDDDACVGKAVQHFSIMNWG